MLGQIARFQALSMSLQTWFIYFLAAVGLSLSPGPNGLLALSHGALYGRRKTLFTVAGGALGFATIIALSMFGIGALLRTSLVWLTVLKWLGGAYLVWLGVQVWRAPPIAALSMQAEDSVKGGLLFRQGALSAMTNPKGILFFAAFLPQFIDPEGSLWLQFLIMAGTFVAIECVTELLIASLAQRVSRWLARVGRGFNRACGAVFVAIGLVLPLRA